MNQVVLPRCVMVTTFDAENPVSPLATMGDETSLPCRKDVPTFAASPTAFHC